METKIYLIEHNTGEYEDTCSVIIGAYFSKQKRDIEIARLTQINDEMESQRDYWTFLSDKLDSIETPEYDDFWDNHTDGDVPEEYENYLYSDSFERFKFWLNKEMSDEYNKHDEDFWKKMFNYYITLNGQYGASEPGYYLPRECKLFD
jgi:hypothetical protein